MALDLDPQAPSCRSWGPPGPIWGNARGAGGCALRRRAAHGHAAKTDLAKAMGGLSLCSWRAEGFCAGPVTPTGCPCTDRPAALPPTPPRPRGDTEAHHPECHPRAQLEPRDVSGLGDAEVTRTSAPEREADEIDAKPDIGARMSAVGGKADVVATWLESPLLAKSSHAVRWTARYN